MYEGPEVKEIVFKNLRSMWLEILGGEVRDNSWGKIKGLVM